ncbi:acyltransferase family protein [Pseudonocardia sp. HH130630-07]|uniref:acyltransferase family protein n=1 Tax=Pseudonocardia sp. HH130630-07 TaxID=1690815 RepID=UPI000814D8F7|nr:acyltransferase [Pseudonocardia sp. HH130630-07]ANY10352.1 acyltransferase [Pseudonocardia sp. HH130630-07]
MPATTHSAAAPPVTSTNRSAALDGLRGVAVLGVLAFHTGLLPGGFLGVDLFFALSGYLITDLLLREVAATGTVSLRAFWGRRTRRLLPATAVLLLVTGAGTVLFGPPDLARSTLSDGPWVQLNLQNWHLLAESASYWDRFGQQRVFEHLWSVAVEEQFYLAWPLLVVLLARGADRAGSRVLLAAALLSLGSVVLMAVLADPVDPTRVHTGTDTRAFSLLVGAAAATGPVRAFLARLPGRWPGGSAAAAAAGIAAALLLVDGERAPLLFTGGLALFSVAAALLIALCVQAPRSWVARLLAVRPLTGAGRISYALYLWHWPVIVLLPGGPGDPLWTVTVCAVSVGAAILSTVLVEDPVRFRAGWARGRSGLAAVVTVTIGLAVLWAVLWVVLPAPPPVVVDVSRLG